MKSRGFVGKKEIFIPEEPGLRPPVGLAALSCLRVPLLQVRSSWRKPPNNVGLVRATRVPMQAPRLAARMTPQKRSVGQ